MNVEIIPIKPKIVMKLPEKSYVGICLLFILDNIRKIKVKVKFDYSRLPSE